MSSASTNVTSQSRSLSTAEEERPVLSVSFSKQFPSPVGKILDEFHLECKPGEIVALLGTSGCGKSTILNLIAGLLPPDRPNDSGSAGSLHALRVGYAFQRPELLPWRTCEGNALHEAEVFGERSMEVSNRVEHLLQISQLSKYRHLYPEALSVGMQQRLQLVRVMACPRPIMLFDEPLGAVDEPSRLRIAEAIRRILKQDNAASIWVTHDSLEAVTVADTVLVLGGRPLVVSLTHLVDRSHPGVPPVAAPNAASDISLDTQAAALRSNLLGVAVSADEPGLIPTGSSAEAFPSGAVKTGQRLASLALPLLPTVLFLLAWELTVAIKPELRFYVSTPSEWLPLLASGLFSGQLLGHLGITLMEAGFGLFIGGPLAVLIGFSSAHSERVSHAVRPTLVGLSAVPLFVLAPAFILWFGIGVSMKIAIAALSAFPFVAYMTHDHALEAKGRYYKYLRAADAKASRLFATLIVPAALEGIIDSLRPAAVAALIGAFLGEFIAANEGLGYYIILQASRYHVAEVFAGVSLLFVVAIVIDWICRKASTNRHRIVSLGRVFWSSGWSVQL